MKNKASILSESIVWHILAWSALVGRLYFSGCRTKCCHSDLLVILSMCATTASLAVFLYLDTVERTLLPHTRTAPLWTLRRVDIDQTDDLIRAARLRVWADQTHIIALVLLKTSCLASYIETTWLRRLRKLIYTKEVLILCAFAGVEALFIAGWCKPFKRQWAPTHAGMECFIMMNHHAAMAFTNLITSGIILCIPIFALSSPRSPLDKRFLVGVLLFFGASPIVVGGLAHFESVQSPFGAIWISLCLREMLWAMILINMPDIWPLWDRLIKLVCPRRVWNDWFKAPGKHYSDPCQWKEDDESIPLKFYHRCAWAPTSASDS